MGCLCRRAAGHSGGAASDSDFLSCIHGTRNIYVSRSFGAIELAAMVESCVVVGIGLTDGRQCYHDEDGELAEHCSRQR